MAYYSQQVSYLLLGQQNLGAAVAKWLSSWLAEQEVQGPPRHLNFRDWLSPELPSHDMAEIPLKRRKSSIQPTNQSQKNLIFMPPA